MAQYTMQEMNLPNEEGKRLLYPRMVLAKRVGLQEVAEALERSSTYTTSDVIGVLQGVARELAWLMAQGHPVKLDGIGTFTPALTLRKGKDPKSPGREDPLQARERIVAGDRAPLPPRTIAAELHPFFYGLHTGATARPRTGVS